MGNGAIYRGEKLTAHLHLQPRLRTRGTIPPLPPTSSWRGSYLKRGKPYLLPLPDYRINKYVSYIIQEEELIFNIRICYDMLPLASIYLSTDIVSKFHIERMFPGNV
jgi:hypothetical protein